MTLYFVIDGEPTEAEIDLIESVKEFAEVEKGLVVNPTFIGGHPRKH
jgi:hypothetical protein